MIRWVTTVIMLQLTLPVAAQSPTIEPAGLFTERYALAAEISGTPVVGLVRQGNRDLSLRRITARIPSEWGGLVVCARMVSSDGRYEAERDFDVPGDWTGGPAALDFPTLYGPQLARLKFEETSVLVSAGACGAPAMEQSLVPAGWNVLALDGSATVMVNSFRADETYLYVSDLDLQIDCVALPTDRRTAYDTQCALPETLLASGALVSVELNRIRRGTLMQGDLFTIDLR